MIANSAPSVTPSRALGGFGGSTSSTGAGDSFSTLVDQSSQAIAAKAQAEQVQQRKAASDKAADDAAAAQAAAEDQTAKTDAAQAAADQATAAQTDDQAASQGSGEASSQAATEAAATASTQASPATTTPAQPTAPATAAATAALQKPKPHATPALTTAVPLPASTTSTTTAARTQADAQTTDAALPSAADASATPAAALALLNAASAASTASATAGVQAQASGAQPSSAPPASTQTSLASGVSAPHVSPLSGLRVTSAVNVRVTSTTAAAATPASVSATWQADLNAAASAVAAASNPTTQDSDAAPASTVAALIGGATQVADQAGSTVRATDRGVNAPGLLNVATGAGAVTADTAAVVGAAGSASNSGFQDSDQQGAAKVVRDQANAAKLAQADSDMPDAVLEAAFGGLLAAAPASSTAADDVDGTDTAVTSDTITDLASQTAAQASVSPGGVKSFQIVLNPEGLGQVTVSVSIAADGKLNAAFTFERPEAAVALSAQAGDLHAALAQSGFDASASGLTFAAAPQAIAATPMTSSTLSLTLNLDQAALTAGGVQGAIGSVRDWAQAASQTADLAALAYGRLIARGLDVRA